MQIKFGTDGWRAIIAQEFTTENLARVAEATALWLKKNNANPSAVVGNDCRFGGKLFSEITACILAAHGVKVFLAPNAFVSTPMISLATVNQNASAGIIITASHNPASYNGFKIKAHYGGPATPANIAEVEALIPEKSTTKYATIEAYIADGMIEHIDPEVMYIAHVEANIDMEAIRASKLNIAYDAMYGAGQNVIREILPEATYLHCEHNPGFDGQAPEPILKNLLELQELITISGDIDSALATDGDADRIGLFDGEGNFVDSHHIILLLIHYLNKIKGLEGKVITTFSCTEKIAKLCEIYGLKHSIKKIGFKYICEEMMESDETVLVGGEESGGIAVAGHIPERDGIWIGLMIWEMMVKSGRTLPELIEEIYDIVGEFAVERYDLHITETQKQNVITNCKNGQYTSFGVLNVSKTEDLDGFKYHFGNDEWVMIRPSGTEPVLRVYAEAENSKRAFEILDIVKAVII